MGTLSSQERKAQKGTRYADVMAQPLYARHILKGAQLIIELGQT